jgi:A/G-specific adenine glycosylase
MSAIGPPPPVPSGMHEAVLEWYAARGRELPFRRTTDPYAVLVSEVMAQQTQISRVSVSWTAFLAEFPTIGSLAAAGPADVLRAWRGLGYNRRGLNLWRAARIVVAEHDGRLPNDIAALERLPGVGRYTARAVAAIAFGRPVGAVDTNVRRVLGRLVAGSPDVLAPRRLQAVADGWVPVQRAAAWTHALMDVGAMLCRSARTDCSVCPLRPWCAAAQGSVPVAASRRRRGDGPVASAADFRSTSRWLRGRIADRLRDAAAGAWTTFEGPIGEHSRAAVGVALRAMERDGLVELSDGDVPRARLPELASTATAISG